MRTLGFASRASVLTLLLVLAACGTNSVGPTSNPPQPQPGPSDTTAPSVSITSPTGSANYSTSNASVSLGGSASDNVGVSSVTWSNAGNGNTGTASGTTAWSIASIALVQGTNAITVTAHDAAGNTRNATLTVSYNPAGGTSLSGSVDSSLINRNGLNAVYVYNGTVVPDDIGSATPPLTTAPVTQDNNACTFSYQLAGLAAGTYTVAFTNQAANDTPANEAITFVGTTQVTVGAGGGAVQNFLPTGRVLRVGPTRTGPNTFKLPSAAAAVAANGDVIEIDAGTYTGDAASWAGGITLRGINGRAYMNSMGAAVQGKGIWVLSGNVTVENIEFSGATVPDHNGAGIRFDGSDLIVCNSFLHDNEDGLLATGRNILVEYSEFGHNGNCIDPSGCAHNMYIGAGTQSFTLRHSYSHDAHEGHLVKSRALENHILYNRITEESGDASYQIDLPQTGRSFIIGNLIQKGTTSQNSGVITFGVENANNPLHELYMVNNTIVNDTGSSVAFLVLGGGFTPTIRIVNNIFAGSGSLPSGAGITSTSNLSSSNAATLGLVNRSGFDYHLLMTSQAVNAGTAPGTAASVDLTPTSQYVHPTSREDRPVNGTIDIGAYEFQ